MFASLTQYETEAETPMEEDVIPQELIPETPESVAEDTAGIDDTMEEAAKFLETETQLRNLLSEIQNHGLSPATVRIANTYGVQTNVLYKFTHGKFPAVESFGNEALNAQHATSVAAMEGILSGIADSVAKFFGKVADLGEKIASGAVNMVKAGVAKVLGLFKGAKNVDESKAAPANGVSYKAVAISVAVISAIVAVIAFIVNKKLPGTKEALMTWKTEIASKITGLFKSAGVPGVAPAPSGSVISGAFIKKTVGDAPAAETLKKSGWIKANIDKLVTGLKSIGGNIVKALGDFARWLATSMKTLSKAEGDVPATGKDALWYAVQCVWSLIRNGFSACISTIQRGWTTVRVGLSRGTKTAVEVDGKSVVADIIPPGAAA